MENRRIKVAVAMPLWKRPQLAAAVMHHMNYLAITLEDDWEFKFLAVGSEGNASRVIAEEHGFDYIEHENKPVWKKWNAAITKCFDYDPDFVWAPGDDEIVDASLFRHYKHLIDDGVQYMGTLDFYLWEPRTGRVKYCPGYEGWRKGESMGPWRLVSKDVLNRLGWKYYDEISGAHSMFVDGSLQRRIKALADVKSKMVTAVSVGAHPVSIKVDANINNLDDYPGDIVPPDLLNGLFPAFTGI